MPSKADRDRVIGEFDAARYPEGKPTLATAWLGIYQVLWWFQTPAANVRALLADAPEAVREAMDAVEKYIQSTAASPPLHVREANDLGKPIWRERARMVEEHIAEKLGVTVEELPVLFDRMMRLDRWAGQQRNNPLGNGLRILVAEVLRRWGDPRFDYKEERRATEWFPGIKLPGRSLKASMDVSATREDEPAAIASCKWSIRHDRISDPTNECQEYKAAAVKRQMMHLRYDVVTNELDLKRLEKVLDQPCVDALVHIRLPLVFELHEPTPDINEAISRRRLFDLTEWVALTYEWR